MERILDKKYNDKYQQKMLESFNSRLELYLFNLAKVEKKIDSAFNKYEFLNLHDNINYQGDNLKKKCEDFGASFSSTKDEYKDIDWKIDKWCDINTENNKIEKYYEEYMGKFTKELLTRKDFEIKSNSEHCHYCKTTLLDIKKLFANDKIYRKSYTRGITFELDRIIPNWEYSENNTVACCYWCNNAKTDEFFGEEFDIVGTAIGEVFKQRLTKIK